MNPLLCGLETEYGLYVEGRGAENQIDDAMALVRSFPGERRVVWDYRFESPRADLRGFSVERLRRDPEDARFDAGRNYGSDAEVRSDVVLPNGARFYNDHGHPEYATPECRSISYLAAQDFAGIAAVRRAMGSVPGARAYRNNTDFHGASYGTHESYLVPRELGFDRIARAMVPLLVARPLLCGAGKVGSEAGGWCDYQISQRADFLSEVAGVDTLFRRPLFNTRDEPHADSERWIRVHTIAGDANMIPGATRRKVGLAQIALRLAEMDETPCWTLADPVRAAREVSRNPDAPIGLFGRSHTIAEEILRSLTAAAQALFEDGELRQIAGECDRLLDARGTPSFAREVDWAAKRAMLDQIQEETSLPWRDLQAYDLEYHNIDPDEGLFWALAEMDAVESEPIEESLLDQIPAENTRARARAIAVRFPETTAVSWGSVTIEGKTYPLDPERDYSEFTEGMSPAEFVSALAS